MSYQCPTCPAASFCSCSTPPSEFYTGPHMPPPNPVTFTTVSATPVPEALETRLAAMERRLDDLYKAHEVDRLHTMERLGQVELDVTRVGDNSGRRLEWLETSLPDAKDLWDRIHADTRKRVTALEQAVASLSASKPRTRPRRPRASSSGRTPVRRGSPIAGRKSGGSVASPRKRAPRTRRKV